MDIADLLNDVVKDLSGSLMRQTTLMDEAPEPERILRGTVCVAVLRSYARIIEEQTVPANDRGVVEQFTNTTTQQLREALKVANQKKDKPR